MSLMTNGGAHHLDAQTPEVAATYRADAVAEYIATMRTRERDLRAKVAQLTAKLDEAQTLNFDNAQLIQSELNGKKQIAQLTAENRGLRETIDIPRTKIDAWIAHAELQTELATLRAANVALTDGICGGCKTAKARVVELEAENASLRPESLFHERRADENHEQTREAMRQIDAQAGYLKAANLATQHVISERDMLERIIVAALAKAGK